VSGPPRTCQACGRKPVAHKRSRVCYDCYPDGPIVPPPCRRCGQTSDYCSAGLCGTCHQYSPGRFQPASCRDCHAWGVRRIRNWLCHACIGWQGQYPTVGDCHSCGQRRHLGRGPFCRLCWRTASTAHRLRRKRTGHSARRYQPLDVMAANRHGQQLFFADLDKHSRRRPSAAWSRAPSPAATTAPPTADSTTATPSATRKRKPRHRQLALWDNRPPSWAARHGVPDPPDSRLAAALDALAADLAARHGWSRTTRKRVRLALKVLLGQQPRPQPTDSAAKSTITIRASDVDRLNTLGLYSASLVRLVLAEAGLLDDDRVAAIDRWYARHTAGLPAGMQRELGVWFDIMRNGSHTPPRRRPRAPITIWVQLRHALPLLEQWAAAGHQSLRELSRHDVLASLPPGGNPRALTGVALRSIFGILRARRLVFVNPTARIPTGAAERRQPVPVDVELVKAALHSPDPARAALTALLAFYALRRDQLRALRLTDIHDRRLHLDGRSITIPAPVQQRLAAYLDHRSRRWPSTANPHLFINQRTAAQTGPVGPRWIRLTLQLPPRALREDRILDEAHAQPGDARRLCDLFDMSVNTAERFVAAVEHPDLAGDTR
jgi:hypothetical protein